MASRKALDDDQLILMAWEVAVRRGWEFVIDTLLRGGIELFPPDSSTAEEKGFWEGVGRGAQLGLFSPPSVSTGFSTVMGSKESGVKKEEGPLWDIFRVSSSDLEGQKRTLPSGGGHGLNTSPVTHFSSNEKSPVKRKDNLNLSIDSRIQQFIAEATIFFNKYFSNTEMSTGAQDLSAPQSEESRNDPSSVIFEDLVPEVLSNNAPSEERPIPVSRLPLAAPLQAKSPVQQVAMVPAMPASQSVAVAEPALQQPTNKTSLSPPLGAHICTELQNTVVSLKYFNMFGLLQGRSREVFLSQIEMGKNSDCTIYKWQQAFAIMGSILLENAPEKMKGFFNYGETIRSVYEKGKAKEWLIYDEKFRKLKECQPDLRWDTMHSELLQQFCSQPVTFASSIEVLPTVATAGGNCYLYNKDQCHMGSRCHYYHVCGLCAGEHPKIYCPKLNSVSGTPPLKRTK